MIKEYCNILFVLALASGIGFAQSDPESDRSPRVKVVITDSTPPRPLQETGKPVTTPTSTVAGRPRTAETAYSQSADTPASGTRTLSFRQIKNKLAEAKRQMQTRPHSTALTEDKVEGVEGSEIVQVAFHNWKTNELDYVAMTKDAFLSTKEDKQLISQNGLRLTSRTIRANGVNTPITLIDEDGVTHLPLMVQYPVIRDGKFIETAYYMSTHPGIVTPEVVNAGKLYIRNVIEIARDRLDDHGIRIQPKIADIAERLAVVEHVDHARFRNELHNNIYNDVFTLFALNEGQTYRYSVSSAGAGGLVQMIPSTYRMIRGLYPGVPLMPDFVEGMRDHVNAAQAMLLYIQFTWDDLVKRQAVADALLSGIATQEQLMAAGYNSNPARLSGYITRGGAEWTELIPRETKIYLQIYSSIESNVPTTKRLR